MPWFLEPTVVGFSLGSFDLLLLFVVGKQPIGGPSQKARREVSTRLIKGSLSEQTHAHTHATHKKQKQKTKNSDPPHDAQQGALKSRDGRIQLRIGHTVLLELCQEVAQVLGASFSASEPILQMETSTDFSKAGW